MSEGHWVVSHVINGIPVSFNMDTLITMWAAMAFLIAVSFAATRNLSVFPSGLQLIFEKILGYFKNLTDSMIGKDGQKHFPLIASLFLFIVTANLMGQLPLKMIELKHGEMASPTNDINLTAAMAIIVLIYYVGAGFKKKGFRYFLHDFKPMSIFMAGLEVLDMITRPLTLALRLFGNILAGECLMTALLGICAYFLPLPVMFFEVLVACVQALVFALLTTVYISSAIEEGEH
jgi:F-type H+-transporting ATPase subunit a